MKLLADFVFFVSRFYTLFELKLRRICDKLDVTRLAQVNQIEKTWDTLYAYSLNCEWCRFSITFV